MTELSFLVDLLVNHKLPKLTKEAVVARIKDVEAQGPQRSYPSPVAVTPTPATAQTAAAQQALAARQSVIAQAMSGTREVGQTTPKKFRGQLP